MRSGGVIAILLLALALAGCSGEDDGTVAPPPTTTASLPETGPGETLPEAEPDLDAGEDPGEPGNGRQLELEEVASGLEAPVHAAAAPGEPRRLYVVEQPGRIRVLQNGRLRDEPFLDIVSSVQSGGERGLLSVAFHPDYAANGLFYVNYTDGGGNTRVVEYGAGGGAPSEERELLAVEQPYGNHNGGQLAFGLDGLLYVGMGDGGSSGDPENRAQDLSTQLGKLLRIDVDDPSADWEIVGYGLRNPWRFSFDRETGDLWIGDVGQGRLEEIDLVPAEQVGELLNFGWNVFEGSDRFREGEPNSAGSLVDPLTEYTHDFGCSVTGGFVYRGPIRSAWGRYFYGDYCSGRVWSLALWEDEVSRRGHPFQVPGLSSFAEDEAGELYLLSVEGVVYRLAPR
ncbi:MAG TPA: PQQ-dependent sugar dehydrogenase [Gaiellaceae bacterium]|nr:PQQ-dependent sugar dehydrogenase [Gaiellaceae bacterium]